MTIATQVPSTPLPAMTPTGLQSCIELEWRRWWVAALNLAAYVALMGLMASILHRYGWGLLETGIFATFALVAPWGVLGLTNSLLGLWLLHVARDWRARVAPYSLAGDVEEPLKTRTAVLMTLRNEDAPRAFARLRQVAQSVEETGHGDAFSYFVLSDSSHPAAMKAEQAEFAAWQAASPGLVGKITYRRRISNEGYKAGNLRDFCEKQGQGFEFFLPLDADSVMDGATILRLVRIGEAHPRLGILQSLVVGAPSASAFGRLFQFGMRHGMRPYAMGSAWWGGDCGQFWGHNALVRLHPFLAYCHLPVLPGRSPLGGAILSHDQVEAALMRRAGFEVRVLPQECGSYEDNPPTLLEFSRRDQRWCQGNMQYFSLLNWPGLLPASRFQLAWAIAMFIGQPAFNLLLVLLALKAASVSSAPAGAASLYWLFLALMVLPKLAGFVDVAVTPGELRRYGGPLRFFGSAAAELVFSFLMSAIVSFRTAMFLLGLPFGRAAIWSGQSRDAAALTLATCMQQLWGATLFGLGLLAWLAWHAPGIIPWALPYIAGLVVAVPFAMVTSLPQAGEALRRWGVCAIPEEISQGKIR